MSDGKLWLSIDKKVTLDVAMKVTELRWRGGGLIMPRGPKGEKRPCGLNQWAKRMVDIATGEVEDRDATPEEQGKDPAAVARVNLAAPRAVLFEQVV